MEDVGQCPTRPVPGCAAVSCWITRRTTTFDRGKLSAVTSAAIRRRLQGSRSWRSAGSGACRGPGGDGGPRELTVLRSAVTGAATSPRAEPAPTIPQSRLGISSGIGGQAPRLSVAPSPVDKMAGSPGAAHPDRGQSRQRQRHNIDGFLATDRTRRCPAPRQTYQVLGGPPRTSSLLVVSPINCEARGRSFPRRELIVQPGEYLLEVRQPVAQGSRLCQRLGTGFACRAGVIESRDQSVDLACDAQTRAGEAPLFSRLGEACCEVGTVARHRRW